MQDLDQQWMQTLTGARIRIQIPGAQTYNRLTIIEFVEPPQSAPPVFTKHEFIEVQCVQWNVVFPVSGRALYRAFFR